jgi:hypothetical protein
LTKQYGREVVDIRPSSVSSTFEATRIIDFEIIDSFLSTENSGQSISYRFRNRRVSPTGYSIRRNEGCVGESHLKSWVVEVGNKLEQMVEVDHREDNSDLNFRWASECFQMATPPSELCRYVRLRSIGETHEKNHHFDVAGFELFGDLCIDE